jgi:hypothetical protein
LANQAPAQAICLIFFRTLSTDGVIERMVATSKKLLSFLKALIDCNKKKASFFLESIN